MSVKNDFLKSPCSDAPQNEKPERKRSVYEKENPADYRVWQAYVKIKCQCICIKLCILYVFVDHSDYYFIVPKILSYKTTGSYRKYVDMDRTGVISYFSGTDGILSF